MIISRTPLRISLLGGGTDYPQFYNEHSGAVLGGSIDKYCYVMLHNGKSWRTFDLPNKSGLGSSSAYTVGLLRVCTELDTKTIAQLATVWEQDKMNGAVGSQDQYLCSVGGFHHLKFNGHGIQDKFVEPNELQDYLMMFDTHQYRMASNVVSHQLDNMETNISALLEIKDMVKEGVSCLTNRDYNGLAGLLNQYWNLKRKLSEYVSTPEIDSIYETGLKAGAVGGKLLGGGGGGFFIFLCEPDRQNKVKEVLQDLTYVSFRFENTGSTVIYRD
jgi:D-glycero-alpha-D-manno-heptose-7-phosphate kinase